MRAAYLLFLLLPALAQVQVAATTPILADLVRQVGGGHLQVVQVVPPGADPHEFDLSPGLARRLASVPLLFANGLGLEPFLDRLVRLLPPGARVVRLGEGQPGLICEEKGGCDPHLWLDPTYAVRYAQRIAQELARLDPGGQAAYQAGLERFRQEAEKRDRALSACGLKGVKVVVQHDAFRYFARRYGLVVVGSLADAGEREIGGRSFLELVQKAKKEGVRLVLAEPKPSKPVRTLAEALGARVALLYADTLDEKVPTYLALLDHNRKALSEALGRACPL
ncbi:metal ABC transporter substrate-binding protein [Thermus filiformis]|uniref:ABC transporter substrate-binding protein n=1 Tax=Thermus filiformis TaxID=276 RepID=A0A0A2WNG9_THEFI|nr:metal ABC transporter substrate-binding protein [Thermus filiformis]KGQ21691.1 ABC transporter substrate-binding protein [Thermus filiformis]